MEDVIQGDFRFVITRQQGKSKSRDGLAQAKSNE
jgi:hypothetical protein